MSVHVMSHKKPPHIASIEFLVEKLEEAREGKIHGLVMVWIDEENETSWGNSDIPPGFGTKIVGGLQVCSFDLAGAICNAATTKG
jgi:hypothetical protein